MTAIAYLSSLGPEWLIPLTICPMIYQVFSFTDGIASSATKTSLTTFIKTGAYESYLGDLPESVESLFIRVFGLRHLGKKCIIQSIKLSLISTISATLLIFVLNFQVFHIIYQVTPKIEAYLRNTPPKTPELMKSYEIIQDLLHSRLWIVFAPILWIGWAVLPDYISLLKTRIVLLVLKHTKVDVKTMLLITVMDFLLGLMLFFASFTLFQFLYLIVIFVVDGQPLTGSLGLYFVLFWILFSVELLFFTLTGAVFLFLPISSLFWASLVPSLWMWVYLCSATLARASFKSKRLRSTLVHFLDFDNKPIKSSGFISSLLAGIVSFVSVSIYTLMRNV